MQNTQNQNHKYYRVVANIDGTTEELYGSFMRQDCLDEMACERDGWKADGYKKIRIEVSTTAEAPARQVYSKQELKEIAAGTN